MRSVARRRAVVTGGAGFLGSWLCELLLAECWQVTCVDNYLTGRPENVAHLQGPTFRLLECDVTTGLELGGRIDVVFHLASPASPVDYLRHPLETLKASSDGSWHALDLARRTGARFLLCLLYTSPSPRDGLLSRMPSSA